MKHIDEIYKDWCGTDRHTNDCHPVHDSSETIEFAEYYHREMKQVESESDFSKVFTHGVGFLSHKVNIEEVQRLVHEHKPTVIISGHNLPPDHILIGIVEGVKEKHPELFDNEKLFNEPMKIHPFNAPMKLPEITYQTKKEKKGHERPYNFHR